MTLDDLKAFNIQPVSSQNQENVLNLICSGEKKDLICQKHFFNLPGREGAVDEVADASEMK